MLTGISASWRRRLLAAGVGVAVATGSVGGIAIASAGAVPGDPLYNAKKIFESLQLSLSGSPTDQGRDYLHLADVRLGEIDSLLSRPDVDQPGSQTQALLRETLSDLRTTITNGGSLLVQQVEQDGDQTALHALSGRRGTDHLGGMANYQGFIHTSTSISRISHASKRSARAAGYDHQ